MFGKDNKSTLTVLSKCARFAETGLKVFVTLQPISEDEQFFPTLVCLSKVTSMIHGKIYEHPRMISHECVLLYSFFKKDFLQSDAHLGR